ncbi:MULTISPECIES: FAD-binding oxidoreductase [Desulfovibrio]|uniref:Glycolate oxidase n=4 Tax=Desulfovibrio TaxID=872 RepID=A0AA94L131_DESDE|nr:MULTISPECIES: FAD-linked oxidase C-terminal domain-containing protein [Desulfovibrio]ATD80364.1 FAD-binding oxidoreductase [Desulfovibrio sp. G11]MDY0203027.1 FAD-linked oxidase C-terminal domain-containing protein [Desulfovibrio desulfuricans]SFW11909.1 glycolate oxidase [Desulfovibrio desulfuricans]SPD35840.1 CO dehydrogenase flavoprotein-like, FAD-binding, subdomain 2 [Desulfovibrio sp. G11]
MASQALIRDFEDLIGKENVFSSEADRQSYSYDSAVLTPVVPALVLRPTTAEQLGACVKKLYDNGLPMTVRGAGTNLSGGTIPDNSDSVVILTTGLNRILEINSDDLYAVVEPGVITAQFAAEVAKKNLFYPPDPGSQAVSTIGGNIAENAGGLRGLKYGVTKDYLMGIEFFDATGEMVKSGSRTVKCVTGYNLAGMMVQSEGTLGIISQAILKLVPPPKASKALMAVFENVQDAAEAVAGIIAAHVVPCTLEFLDNNTIVRVDDFTKAGLPREAGAILLIEVDGHPAQVADDAEAVERVLKANRATAVHVPKDADEKFKLWEARRMALPVLARCRPTTVLEDATVPRSQIPAMMKAVNEIAAKYKVEVGTFGHAGDGNLHPTFLCDKRDKDEFHRVEEAIDEMFDVALKLHGTLSGEHGIGTAKAKWMEKETSRGTILFSQRLRRALDPKGLFNATKLVGI